MPAPNASGSHTMNRAVFLDRDGTIIHDVGYLNHPDRLSLIPGALESIRMLRAWGYLVVVVTNQAGIAKGLIEPDMLPEIHRAFAALLRQGGAEVDGIYFCPHHPEGCVEQYARACSCRKPAPGMLLQAADDHDIDLTRSYVVGDKVSDVQLGHNAGAAAIMVLTGYGREHLNSYPAGCRPPDFICSNLFEAAQWVLQQEPCS